MEKGKQVVIVDEEPEQLRVCIFKNILYILRRFFRYVEEHPFMFRGIIKYQRDVVLLQAFLTHRPQAFDEEGTLEEIHYFAHEAAMIISEYDLEEMDEDKASELVKRVNVKLIVMSRWMDLIRMIYGKKEREQLRVCFDKDILQPHLDALFGPLEDQVFFVRSKDWEITLECVVSMLSLFLLRVEESPDFMVVPGMKQVCDDVALLQAFLLHRPPQFFQDGRLMKEINYFAKEAAFMFRRHCREAFKLVKRFNCHLKVMSHWMDLIRIIYGKQPKASPPVYCFVDNLAPLDAVLDYLQQSPWMEYIFKRVVLLRAILMDPPEEDNEDDSTLKKSEFIAREVGFTISSIDLNNMDEYMADRMLDRLQYIFLSPTGLLGTLESEVEEIYAKRPKPSRKYYPKTAQLDFVDLLVDNLGELLVKAEADASICFLKFDISKLQRELQDVSCHLMKIPEACKEEADLKDNITNIANLAYEAEYVIDSVLIGGIPILYSMLWLRDILQELEHQRELVKMRFGDVQSIVRSIEWSNKFGIKIVPIFHTNTEICDTLLREVSDKVRWKFSVCTRSLVSSYKERKKKVFLDLLRNAEIHEDSESDDRSLVSYKRAEKLFIDCLLNTLFRYPSDMSEADVEESLYNLLKDRRYFVILEDVQDIYALNDIKRVLPDHGHSVILFTTPSSELVLHCHYGFNQMSEHHPSTSQTDKPTIEKDVVGFMEETKKMLEHLIGGPKKLLISSIFGMAGQGKTTLAHKLFSDPLVNKYFDTRAWCCVSQVYDKRQILLELLGQVVQLDETDHHKVDVELAEMLYKQLKGRRFLVFLDDMWKIDAWNNLARCFPDDKNGSRIMFTTRIQGLASQAKSDSILQPLGLLSEDESWALMEKKLFQKESCPIELLCVGRQIAKNCKGLPLSVVLTVGLLAKMEKRVNQWEQIAKSLSSLILDDAKTLGKGVIELSYKHLPDHLKSCFLYFGAFLEDREVQVSKLIRLWIAEGFVKYNDLKSLEDVAEDYFIDLIGRSLVTIAQEKSNGAVKSCHVHDLLREFCLTKAKEENFLHMIDGYDQDMDLSDSSFSMEEKCHLRRLCIYPKKDHFTMLKPSGPFVRSLLFFVDSDTCPSYSYDFSSIFLNFKFLKTLNLEGINVGDSFKEIGALILLRYLTCQSYVDLIPSSIANLWNLQTFLFKGLGAEVVKVSDSIWDMTKLRHVHINDSASFELDPSRLENSFILDNLQTFSTPCLAYGDDMDKIMRRLRGIRKLKCIFLDSWNEATNCNKFPELDFLSQLLSLNVFYNGMGKYPCEFNFPSNLKKLTLSNFRMPWNEISQLAKLCELEVLKLLSNAFEGETWEVEDEVFPKLKFLKLDTLNVVEWSATRDHFPCLERLLLYKCEQLEEIPPGIGDIDALQMIEVMWCNSSTAISAVNIQKEKLEYCAELKIHVHPKI